MKGVTFGEYHSYRDLNLLLKEKEIGAPEVKRYTVDVEGADGELDYTDYFGEPKYQNVQHRFTFSSIQPYQDFMKQFSMIKNAIHGKKEGSSLTMTLPSSMWGVVLFPASQAQRVSAR